MSTVGFWGDINFFHEHRHDIPPMKIYNVGVCLVQFLKFFMEPFWRNCNFKILTLNPGFSALKCKNPLKSTILSILGMLYGKSGLFFIRKKILVWSWQLYRKKMVKNAFQVKNLGFLKFLIFKMFFNISQFLMEFQLQFIGLSERAFQDAFFEYSNLYFTFWKVWVMT